MKVALAATTILAVAPIVVAAEEVEYVKWNEKTDTYHLYDDVRTITFSNAVDATSLKDITIWNDTTNTAVAAVATIGEKDNQVVVKLADDAEYINHHSYTLTIQGVKQLATKKVIAPTKYSYKMVCQQLTTKVV